MRSFRLSHAGVVVEDADASLLIDPGSFSSTEEIERALAAAAPPAALVITHEHGDHWTAEHVRTIRRRTPELPIFTTAATAEALRVEGIPGQVTVVHGGDRHSAGPFSLDFYGKDHAVLHSSIPVIENVGVIVNCTLAFGGDALVPPPQRAELLGIPIGSPWSNIGEVMDFVLAAAPKRAYVTHDEMLSAAGRRMYSQRVEWCLAQSGGELIELPRLDADTAARYEFAPRTR